MLQLKNITKSYKAGTTTIEALNGVDLAFRDNEFVAILGPSGCGKTTMLNILGGLDRYTDGDLVINGRSTKDYKDRDWDNYRNRRVGFVFQNYNLITHQSVLANVELAMTLSGVGKAERRRRAREALELVGLSDQLKKKPNQMSGGQMQRVAIARALVNNPDILMADEPTGALDSATSVQIMEILSEIASDRLVIMVTHNSDLAEHYANRTVRLLDGKVIDDSNPLFGDEISDWKNTSAAGKERKPSMSFFTALGLSLNNLMTKKARTFLTAFAGSIGIIGIALILSLSNGMQTYIDDVQRDTLSSYPIQIQEQNADIGAMMSSMVEMRQDAASHDDSENKVYSLNIMSGMMKSMSSQIGNKNDLASFKKYLDAHLDEIDKYTNAINYNYNVQLNVFKGDPNEIVQVNPAYFMQQFIGTAPGDMSGSIAMGGSEIQAGSAGGMSSMMGMANVWSEMLDNPSLLQEQYDVVAGKWPANYDEIVIVVQEHNNIPDYSLYCLGLKDSTELQQMFRDVLASKDIEVETAEFTYDELLALTYKVIPNAAIYQRKDGLWHNMSDNKEYMRGALNNAITLKVTGIIRPKEGASATAISGNIGYLPALTKELMSKTFDSEIVGEQLRNQDVDVFTGKPFSEDGSVMPEFDMSMIPAEYQDMVANMSDEQLAAMMEQYAPTSNATFDNNKLLLGIVDEEHPNSISIYPKDFESKDVLSDFIKKYNDERKAEDEEAQPLRYTDFMALLMGSVSNIIDAISTVLIAFVSISLVVSSIMIGIITYVSVLERTKEIGILKSIGASKHDISGVFNAETLIVGLFAGAIGIGLTVLINIPANIIITSITNIPNVSKLPIAGAVILIVLSCLLTFIAGLIPAKSAANKDPVEALRTD
ncbi:MAG: ABC transporter ATP-binding protein/permease [Oscillospiraceae bacterium]|jgi:putative ABC transport system permease protein|nr:ABC transporter ATP-binding protein/permease [Oscillospiraceae bacterium]